LNDEVPATFNLSDITRVELIKYPTIGSIGAGIGVPYGAIGVNTEVAIFKYFSLSAGFGSTIYAGSAYSVGGRAYFASTESKFRPRISAHYGTNAVISVSGIDGTNIDYNESFNGLSLGAGILGMFGESRRFGFDFDIIYLATRGDFDNQWDEIKNTYSHIEENTIATGKIKISMGLRIAF